MPPNPTARNDPKYLVKALYFPDKWTCESTNATYIRRFLQLAASHKIPVFWILPPIRPDVQAKREQLGLDGLYLRLVHSYQTQFTNLTVVDGRHSDFVETVFQDPSHLDREGAASFSVAVARVLKNYLAHPSVAGPRWVALPSYRADPSGAPLEDFEQSKIAVRLDAQRRRF